MHPMLNIAIRAARRAGDQIVRQMDQIHGMEIRAKGANDFVTEVDQQAERVIIDTLLKAYPDHAILAEESGARGESDHVWIIDPLDGTTNFLHGYPQFAVSIALQIKGRLEQAVIYDPLRQDLFTASRGAGAHYNNQRMRVGKRPSLEGALLGTGFPIRNPAGLDDYLQGFRALFPKTAGIRRAGAASLDLAYVARGWLDGFWEYHLQPWDIAAGALLVQEAGGLVGDPAGGSGHMQSGDIVVGNPRIFREIVQTLHKA